MQWLACKGLTRTMMGSPSVPCRGGCRQGAGASLHHFERGHTPEARQRPGGIGQRPQAEAGCTQHATQRDGAEGAGGGASHLRRASAHVILDSDCRLKVGSMGSEWRKKAMLHCRCGRTPSLASAYRMLLKACARSMQRSAGAVRETMGLLHVLCAILTSREGMIKREEDALDHGNGCTWQRCHGERSADWVALALGVACMEA